jgi:hypothetical protein
MKSGAKKTFTKNNLEPFRKATADDKCKVLVLNRMKHFKTNSTGKISQSLPLTIVSIVPATHTNSLVTAPTMVRQFGICMCE